MKIVIKGLSKNDADQLKFHIPYILSRNMGVKYSSIELEDGDEW